ncbi:FtsX-like permease family protein [Eisenbergiella sp.]
MKNSPHFSSLHNLLFYPRLAGTNMKKNGSIYFPYLCAGGLMAGLLYVLNSVGTMVVDSGMEGGDIMYMLVRISFVICVLFVFIILFYINSFIIKRRKREFGLFCILGMEKKHLAFVLFWEVLFSMLLSVAVGIVGGVLFSQAMFLLLLKFVGLPGKLIFRIPLHAVAETFLIYLACFLFVLLFDVVSVTRTNPIDLLKSSREGEREPKTRWPAALAGAAALGIGYAKALATQTASDALFAFFPAVILVIIGTYCLFQAGSIALLKTLRKNKRFYYKPENFVSVSGMIYRMKQNAAGLASICILSTAVLVTLSSCLSLYAGEEDMLKNQFPRDINMYADIPDYSPQDTSSAVQAAVSIREKVEEMAASAGCVLKNRMDFYQVSFGASYTDGQFSTAFNDEGKTNMVYAMVLEDYNRLFGQSLSLGEGEAFYYTTGPELSGFADICGEKYRLAGRLEEFDVTMFMGFATPVNLSIFVVPGLWDLSSLAAASNAQAQNGRFPTCVEYNSFFDLEGSDEAVKQLESSIHGAVPGVYRTYVRSEQRADFYELYGSILFVGVFFIVLFLTATVLIIYYKQITEGFDDRERFQIMEKVGMSAAEVKKTITRQVLLVFFLPLGMAVMHIAVAFPQLCKMLTVFSMTNVSLFALFTVLSVLVFALAYLLVYHLTARTYFKIVQG